MTSIILILFANNSPCQQGWEWGLLDSGPPSLPAEIVMTHDSILHSNHKKSYYKDITEKWQAQQNLRNYLVAKDHAKSNHHNRAWWMDPQHAWQQELEDGNWKIKQNIFLYRMWHQENQGQSLTMDLQSPPVWVQKKLWHMNNENWNWQR